MGNANKKKKNHAGLEITDEENIVWARHMRGIPHAIDNYLKAEVMPTLEVAQGLMYKLVRKCHARTLCGSCEYWDQKNDACINPEPNAFKAAGSCSRTNTCDLWVNVKLGKDDVNDLLPLSEADNIK